MASMRGIRNLSLIAASIASLAMCGCPLFGGEPTIQCSGRKVSVLPGTCTEIDNPCAVMTVPGPGPWASAPDLDSFCLFDASRPPGVAVRTDRVDGVTTRSICDTTGEDGSVVDKPVDFRYEHGRAFGDGQIRLTVASRPQVVISASPGSIGPGDPTRLVAVVSGGVPPYSYAWSGSPLSATGIPNPIATPILTTTYLVLVTDSAGQPGDGSITVLVTAATPPTAAFRLMNPGGPMPITMTLDASISTGNIVEYKWDLSWTARNPDFVSGSPVTTFRWSEGDTRRGATITLTVTAADGQTATVTQPFS